MRSRLSLRQWTRQLLPHAGCCAQQAAWELLRALLLGFTVQLSQLARQTDRPTGAKTSRQFLSRWLAHPAWKPTAIYTHLSHFTRRLLRRGRRVLLLIDTTTLSDGWVVLQVSLPWQGRALPLYRVVYPYAGPERDQPAALQQALCWLEQHLPGSKQRYVLVMDRGFPSSPLVRQLRASGWRFVLRVKGNWRMEGPQFTGLLREAVAGAPLGREPRLYRDVVLGWRDPRARGEDPRGVAHVVQYWGLGHQEVWHLVTTESDAWAAVAIYRERMKIEQEFRDLKGPLGLDQLATWTSQERIASLLAWLAVYEWFLAFLWLHEQLPAFASTLRTGGSLSWIRVAREWIARQLRTPARRCLACL